MVFKDLGHIKPQKPKLDIAKPNREIVGILKEAYNIKRDTKLGAIPILTFEIPYQRDIQKQLVDNPNVNKVKNRYLVKFTQGNETEWYVIKSPTDSMSEDVSSKQITAYGLAYELADKNIRDYSATSINASQALEDALSETLWNIGEVDASFDILYRSFTSVTSNVLDFVFQIASTFNALVIFDSVNRQVNFRVFDTYGQNLGLSATYGKLLQTAEKIENTDDFCTRLKVFGKNGIGILSTNITGQNYIEDYSYFIYPFSRDENGNVLSHSNWMSDSLCNALLDYRALLLNSEGTYQTYQSQLTNYQTTLTSQQNTLTNLQNELAIIEDNIAEANYEGNDTSSLVTQKNNKLAEISTQNSLIATTQTNINTVNASIAALQNSLSIENNFTNDQIQEWNPFIIVGTFENNNVEDPQQLLELATAEFEKMKQPKIVVNISMVNLLECVQEYKRWDMLNLGDIITITNVQMGLNVQAKIIELNFDYESGEISVVVSNVKELISDNARFLRDLYRANMTSASVNMSQYKWDGAYSDVNDVNTILNNKWDATSREIQASVDNSVEISRRGVIVSDPNDPDKILILQKGLLAISGNGGNTWQSVLDPTGLYAQRLVGQIVAGVNLTITNSAGNFLVNQNGVQISDLTLSVTKSDNRSRIILDPANGFKIQSGDGTGLNWTDKLYADTNGNVTVTGKIVSSDIQGGTISIGSGNSIFKVDTSGVYIGNASFASAPFRVTYGGALTATQANITGAINCTSLSINGTNILTGNQISGNYINARGITVTNGSTTTFSVDSNGNVSISGNVTMTGGTITWGSVTAPSYSQVTGTKPPINADNTSNNLPSALGSNYTQIGSTYVYTGTLSANQVTAGTMSANRINGGTISGVTINVNTDLNVGRRIYLNPGSFDAEIVFNSNAIMYADPTTGRIDVNCPRFAVSNVLEADSIQYQGDELSDIFCVNESGDRIGFQIFNGNLEVFRNGSYVGDIVLT